jgi:copper homeostasis protein
MCELEICLSCDDELVLAENVRLAQAAGVDRLELCAQMLSDGLTPTQSSIKIARHYFSARGLLVMIRPRSGDFDYSAAEFADMRQSISMAADCGADGVVLGVLNRNNEIDMPKLAQLVELAKSRQLAVTFHRAFDALNQPLLALQQLINLGVARVLSSGTPWQGGGSSYEGRENLAAYLQHAQGKIEVVIGGGVNAVNGGLLKQFMTDIGNKYSFHAYSSVLDGKALSSEKIKVLQKALRT